MSARPGAALTATPWRLPAADLEAGLERCATDLEAWRGAHVLVTGGTGFLGSWLVASLLHAQERLGLGLRLELLTRDPASVSALSGQCLRLVQGDVRTAGGLGQLDLIVHGAASSSAAFGRGDGEPRAMASTIIEGTMAVLEAAVQGSSRVLLLSSGAVYGRQVGEAVSEGETTAPDTMAPASAYAQAKRMAETLCACATSAGDAAAVVARLFSFVGPRIPLAAHFAAGNFLDDALHRRPVRVRGDGRDVRSYLYAGDLPEWCWALASRGQAGHAYNVGSPEGLTIGELATRVAALVEPPLAVRVDGEPSEEPPGRYVPSTALAERELGLSPRTAVNPALRRTLGWLAGS
ncbi:MAG: NAD-dependent epimerase/dehydratase family protein [Acidimicrobiales bacterium]